MLYNVTFRGVKMIKGWSDISTVYVLNSPSLSLKVGREKYEKRKKNGDM